MRTAQHSMTQHEARHAQHSRAQQSKGGQVRNNSALSLLRREVMIAAVTPLPHDSLPWLVPPQPLQLLLLLAVATAAPCCRRCCCSD